MVRPDLAAWTPLAAQVLGVAPEHLRDAATVESFVGMGGTSLQAIALVARGQRELRAHVEASRLLSELPLAQALADAVEYVDTAPPVAARRPAELELLPGQRSMLAAHMFGRDAPYHLMFTLAADGPLDPARTRQVLRELTTRHETLRTRFVHHPHQARIVLPAPYEPRLLHQTLPGDDTVRAVHDLYGGSAARLLRPFEQPPVVFVLTHGEKHDLLTMLVHHVVTDGWSIGLLWREFAERYTAGGDCGGTDLAAPSPDWVGSRLAAREAAGAVDAALARVATRLAGAPSTVALATDLPPLAEADGRGARLRVQLDPTTARAVGDLARRCGVTVTSVAMAAWALTVSRHAGQPDLILGVPAAGRFEAGMDEIVGLCTRVVPVRCATADELTVRDHVRGVAGALAAAVADADVPFERVVAALDVPTDPARNPLAQFGFAAHHELVPDALSVGGRRWWLHEGHCHGAVFDALLYLQSWSERPRFALEYATSVLTPADAGVLVESFRAALIGLTVDPGAALRDVTTLSPAQRTRLRALGAGGVHQTADDVWSRFATHARDAGDRIAVVDARAGLTLTYRELHDHAVAQSRLLHAHGVRSGDAVLVEVPRSAAEAVAVLGVLRLGAHYVAVDQHATGEWRAHLAAAAAPRVRLGTGTPAPEWSGVADCPLPDLRGPAPVGDGATEPTPAGPARAAYVSFTSGSTGAPKGVVVPHRAVLRLADDPGLFADRTGIRMMRLSPLAFDASTLELLVPLANGDTVVVFPPDEPTPSALAEFLRTEAVTHAWLTSGVFHLVADHRPDAFAGLRQLFTGGGVVSPAHVRRVLAAGPGLRLTNGYGPTENTTFTTTYSVDHADATPDPLPIGGPVHGTDLYVVDPAGRLVPPGAVGELWAAGTGVADGYLNDPIRTDASFVRHDGLAERLYRTGDLVRWGADGQLRFLGRNDRQVKIAGHRVELVDVERRLRARPGVRDAVVFTVGEPATGVRLCAALKPGLDRLDVADVRRAVEAELAPYARPQQWVTVAEFPLDRNGKVDLPALAALVAAPPAGPAPAPARASVSLAAFEELVTTAWVEALGTDDFDVDEAFFDVGGESLRLAVVRRLLQERLAGRTIPLTDLYRFPTVQTLARHLHAQAEGAGAPS